MALFLRRLAHSCGEDVGGVPCIETCESRAAIRTGEGREPVQRLGAIGGFGTWVARHGGEFDVYR